MELAHQKLGYYCNSITPYFSGEIYDILIKKLSAFTQNS